MKDAIGHYWALMIMIPGLYGLAAIIWGLLFAKMKCQYTSPNVSETSQSAVEGIPNENFDEDVAVL